MNGADPNTVAMNSIARY